MSVITMTLSVPAASGFHTILSLATKQNMFTTHVGISQAFVQPERELLPGDGHNGKVYIFSPPGYDEDLLYVYRLLKSIYCMPSAARVWTTGQGTFWACYKRREFLRLLAFRVSLCAAKVVGVQLRQRWQDVQL